MKRFLITTALMMALMALMALPAVADDLSGRTGIGGELGIQKLIGGDHDYSNVDQNLGLWLRHGFTPKWSLEAGVDYGWVRPGATQGEDAGFTFDSTHAFYTTMLNTYAGARYHFAPDKRFGPYAGGRLGVMNWQVRDENGGDFGAFPGGPTVAGFDRTWAPADLEGTNLTVGLTLGAEYFLTESFSLDLGGRYTYIVDDNKDNIGTSALWGAGEADVNSGRWNIFMGGTLYFGGSNDDDGDGIENQFDGCPNEAEDFDGYRDEDGCPEFDNDFDGVLDGDDKCPLDAEDFDGYRDDDGCPDPDNDKDGVIDADDECPEEAEDMDGFEDQDGCPDPDNDGDGVLDADDNCPDTPAGVDVGLDGCPIVAEIKDEMVLEGVSFAHNSADLTSASFEVLDQVVESLAAYPGVRVEIQGHTDSTGSAAYNLDISSRRAASVMNYLAGKGIAPNRLTAVGYGEDLPIADNTVAKGRAANRRVELVRIN